MAILLSPAELSAQIAAPGPRIDKADKADKSDTGRCDFGIYAGRAGNAEDANTLALAAALAGQFQLAVLADAERTRGIGVLFVPLDELADRIARDTRVLLTGGADTTGVQSDA